MQQTEHTFARFLSRAYYASSAELATTGVHLSGGADLFCFCAARGSPRELRSWLRRGRRGSACCPQHRFRAGGGIMRKQKQKKLSKYANTNVQSFRAKPHLKQQQEGGKKKKNTHFCHEEARLSRNLEEQMLLYSQASEIWKEMHSITQEVAIIESSCKPKPGRSYGCCSSLKSGASVAL